MQGTLKNNGLRVVAAFSVKVNSVHTLSLLFQRTGHRRPYSYFKVYYLVIVERVFLSLVGSEHPLTVSRPAPLGRVFTTSGPPEVQPGD